MHNYHLYLNTLVSEGKLTKAEAFKLLKEATKGYYSEMKVSSL